MKRLTSDKDVKDMGMVELAYNSCYGKNGRARYRDYDTDVDARELAIQLLERYADVPNEFTCDDDFDEAIIAYMSYGMENPEGLIAVFYRNLWAMADLRGRLKRYEDAGLSPENIREMDKELSIQAKELMEYRKIGTVEECREAMERWRIKKPIGSDMCTCPNCGTYNEIIKKRRNTVNHDNVYCWHCGQVIEVNKLD